MKLSTRQRTIVDTPGNLMVRASAGTGKTHTMVAKIAKEIEENKTHKVVAAITFTIKAAQEIRDRLSVDISQHFIGTNNSFVIEEIIKPFMKDVYGMEFDKDMSTDYGEKLETYDEAIEKIRTHGLLGSYKNSEKNFIFDLAFSILNGSLASRLYLKSKYFKIYIDEYQDCDRSMHELFMYICDNLGIETFLVGDEKQSIYIWRGAYPQAFVSITGKGNFNTIIMDENFRSCQQIQNYSNLLCSATTKLYSPILDLSNIILLQASDADWGIKILPHLDINKQIALLRYSNQNASIGADVLSRNGLKFTYIPALPITDITTKTAWLYMEIAKYLIIQNYSVYDVFSEIPVEGEESKKEVSHIAELLDDIKNNTSSIDAFSDSVLSLAEYLGYQTRQDHLSKLFQTINDKKYHCAFETDKYKHIAITFHSSKGLEFDQVILFAEDYKLADDASIFNHYVAVTRAKSKLIIVNNNSCASNTFQCNIKNILRQSNLALNDVLTIV